MLAKPQYPTELEHPRFRVVPAPGSRKLVIFFAGTGTSDYDFHFRGQAHQSSANYILVNNGANEWYQKGIPGLGHDLMSTIATLRAWAHALDAPDIYCVGASMGASGAALYGCMLGASVLALGFEAKIGLPYTRSARLGRDGCDYPITDLTLLIAASEKPFHAYIGIDDIEDLIASAHLRYLPNVHVTFMTHVFHGPPAYLKGLGRLRPLVEAFLNGGEMPAMPEKTQIQDGLAEAMYRGYVGWREGNLGEWEAGFRDAVSIRPDSITANLWLGRALIRQNLYADALQNLAVAKNSSVMDALPSLVFEYNSTLKEAAYYFAYALRHLGLHDDAVALHEVTLSKWRKYTPPLIDIAIARTAQGRLEDAIAALERVLVIDPTNEVANKRIKGLKKRLTNPD